jgi:diketogulonate reductase-like aldo/keto reductase
MQQDEGSNGTQAMLKRTVPSTGDLLPVVGCGTWQTFDVGASASEREPLRDVLRTLFDNGGSLIDSSPMYGKAEAVIGDLLDDRGMRAKAFTATKVWTRGREAGIAQMTGSMRLLNAESLDLIQVHNLLDWQIHLPTLRDWREKGRIRYVGVTHYTTGAHDQLASIMLIMHSTSDNSFKPTIGRAIAEGLPPVTASNSLKGERTSSPKDCQHGPAGFFQKH